MVKTICFLLSLTVGIFSGTGVFAQNSVASEKMLAEISQTLAKDPQNVQLQVRKAKLLGQMGRFSEQLDVAKTLIGRFPNERAGYYNASQAQQGLGDFRNALLSFEKMMALPNRKESDFLLRANLYVQNKRYKDALSDVDRAMKSYPNHPSLLITRSQCLYNLGGPSTQSISDLKKVLLTEPQNVEVKQFLEKQEREFAPKMK